jgi:hypothetical protein
MERELKMKNRRKLKVTFHYAEGLSEEEGRRRWNDVFDIVLRQIDKYEKKNDDPKPIVKS